MKRLVLLLCLLALPALASELPAIPPDAMPMHRAACSDNATGAHGMCEVYVQPSGEVWMLFLQQGKPVFLRYVAPGQPYVEVWRAERANI